jgi:N6-L-threonylcarbamoyladenine synthase
MRVNLQSKEGPILGIETSCDETAAAVVSGTTVLSNEVYTQTEHSLFGGVVPEIASRNHILKGTPIIREALKSAGVDLPDLGGIAVTQGPGLVGCLLVGLSLAKGLAWGQGLPLIGVHHIEGHLFSAFIGKEETALPALALIASGGHTDLILIESLGVYRYIARTRDDAAGEAFDKVAKLLDLLEPNEPTMGGPRVAKLAESGDPKAFKYPSGMAGELEFSFSGLKTAVLYHLRKLTDDETVQVRADIAASFQATVVETLIRKTLDAARGLDVKNLILVGGVAANKRLRLGMQIAANEDGLTLSIPDAGLCTDNAAMVAAAGAFRLSRGEVSSLDLNANPRLALPGLIETVG